MHFRESRLMDLTALGRLAKGWANIVARRAQEWAGLDLDLDANDTEQTGIAKTLPTTARLWLQPFRDLYRSSVKTPAGCLVSSYCTQASADRSAIISRSREQLASPQT
jgi:hypothetical protein